MVEVGTRFALRLLAMCALSPLSFSSWGVSLGLGSGILGVGRCDMVARERMWCDCSFLSEV